MPLPAAERKKVITTMPTVDTTKETSTSCATPSTNRLKKAGKKAGSIALLQKASTPTALREAISEPTLKTAGSNKVATISKSGEVVAEKAKKKKKKKLGGAAGSAAAAAKLLAAGKRSKISKTKVVAVDPPAICSRSGSICVQCSSLLGNRSSMRTSLPALSKLPGPKGGRSLRKQGRTTYDLINDEFFIVDGKVSSNHDADH